MPWLPINLALPSLYCENGVENRASLVDRRMLGAEEGYQWAGFVQQVLFWIDFLIPFTPHLVIRAAISVFFCTIRNNMTLFKQPLMYLPPLPAASNREYW
jgi:hypothetical protein